VVVVALLLLLLLVGGRLAVVLGGRGWLWLGTTVGGKRLREEERARSGRGCEPPAVASAASGAAWQRYSCMAGTVSAWMQADQRC